jgi:hypothetical protein
MSRQNNERALLGACLFELGFGGLAILLGVAFGPDPRSLLPRLSDLQGILVGASLGCGLAIPWILCLLFLKRQRWQWSSELFELTRELLKFLNGASWYWLALLALSSGVGEEIFFRGWLQGWIQKLVGLGESGDGPLTTRNFINATLAIFLSALVFGIVHPLSKTYIAFAFAMGLYLGASYCLTGNLLVPIVAHASYNFVAMVWLDE